MIEDNDIIFSDSETQLPSSQHGLTKTARFNSKRLRFRGIEASDAEHIVSWRSDPANYRNFLDAHPLTIEEHLAWFKGYLQDQTRFDFVIEDEQGIPIGTCGLSNITNDSCEISYMIGNKIARGKGFATEAVRALTDVAFRELGIDHVDARILPHNEASMQVARKCGFVEVESVYRLVRPDTRDAC